MIIPLCTRVCVGVLFLEYKHDSEPYSLKKKNIYDNKPGSHSTDKNTENVFLLLLLLLLTKDQRECKENLNKLKTNLKSVQM